MRPRDSCTLQCKTVPQSLGGTFSKRFCENGYNPCANWMFSFRESRAPVRPSGCRDDWAKTEQARPRLIARLGSFYGRKSGCASCHWRARRWNRACGPIHLHRRAQYAPFRIQAAIASLPAQAQPCPQVEAIVVGGDAIRYQGVALPLHPALHLRLPATAIPFPDCATASSTTGRHRPRSFRPAPASVRVYANRPAPCPGRVPA